MGGIQIITHNDQFVRLIINSIVAKHNNLINRSLGLTETFDWAISITAMRRNCQINAIADQQSNLSISHH